MKAIHFDNASEDDVCNLLEAIGFPSQLEDALDAFLAQLIDDRRAIVRTDTLNDRLQAHFDSDKRLFARMASNGFHLKLPVNTVDYIEVDTWMVKQTIGPAKFRVWVRFPYVAYKQIGKICSMFRDMDACLIYKALVSIENQPSEAFSIKAIAAICACHVAGAHGGVEILSDMARDGLI